MQFAPDQNDIMQVMDSRVIRPRSKQKKVRFQNEQPITNDNSLQEDAGIDERNKARLKKPTDLE